MPARHLTVRDVPPDLAKALEAERKRRGKSLNQTIKDLLARSLGVGRDRELTNGLEKYAGTWTQAEFEEFERNTAFLREIDEEMWK